VFSVELPRNWTVYTQNTTELVSATFTAPDEVEPSLTFTVVNLGEEVDSVAFGDIINRYQREIRPDVAQYTEQNRQAMGDGSWRLTGLRQTAGNATQQVNTFIERSGTFIAIIDVVLPSDMTRLDVIERAINTFEIDPSTNIGVTDLEALSAVRQSDLKIVNVSSWVAQSGVLFITGEVNNNSSATLQDVPIRARLLDANGRSIAEAAGTVMGYHIAPGEFAPFSLRFEQGQPPDAASYILALGDETWRPQSVPLVADAELDWTDESQLTDEGQLIVTGNVTNTGETPVTNPLAIITVFDSKRRVIAAAALPLTPAQIAPGDTTEFTAQIPELGDDPEFYIVNIQVAP